MTHHTPTAGQSSERSHGRTRRGFLKGIGATGTAVAGVAAASSPAAAQLFGGGIESFQIDGANPPSSLPNRDASDLLVYLHGLGGGSTSTFQAGQLQGSLSSAGWSGTVIAGNYSSGTVGVGLTGSGSQAETMASLAEGYYDNNPDGSLRVVGHSMGGFLTMQVVGAMGDGYALDTAATIGTGTPFSLVCLNGTYGSAIADHTEDFRAYVSENDTVVTSLGGFEPGCSGGLGGGGTPDEFARVDVTDDVGNHVGYWNSSAVAEDLAGSFEDSGGSDGGGDSGTGDEGSEDGGSGVWGSSGSSDDGGSSGWW